MIKVTPISNCWNWFIDHKIELKKLIWNPESSVVQLASKVSHISRKDSKRRLAWGPFSRVICNEETSLWRFSVQLSSWCGGVGGCPSHLRKSFILLFRNDATYRVNTTDYHSLLSIKPPFKSRTVSWQNAGRATFLVDTDAIRDHISRWRFCKYFSTLCKRRCAASYKKSVSSCNLPSFFALASVPPPVSRKLPSPTALSPPVPLLTSTWHSSSFAQRSARPPAALSLWIRLCTSPSKCSAPLSPACHLSFLCCRLLGSSVRHLQYNHRLRDR